MRIRNSVTIYGLSYADGSVEIALLRILMATGCRSRPSREAIDIIRALDAQGVKPAQIAVTLNTLKIPAAWKQDMWTEDVVITVLDLQPALR